ncbi:FecR family protein [Agitococcus lubricus]|uniref:FecR family protein n=1 Tax=Agitococcus lubricus TaxID=1077255 RepID=A0A2T5IWJ4_9GAMM|nr:FecR domain-containing protein [Agitococcus lubricus]PTQ88305.1 FecR family protein [Agitococcus lubricus]
MSFWQAFHYKHIITATLGVLFVGTAYGETAGRVNFIAGEVTATGTDSKQRPLYKGDLVKAGDKIETTAKGRIQIRMTDGGFISLRPNSVFVIEKYSFSKDTPEQGAVFFKFLQGGVRAISGVIGKVNKNNYQFNTPVATIGIRGTDYSTTLNNDVLKVTVSQGQIKLSTDIGSVDVNEGQSYEARQGQAPSPSSTPVEIENLETEEVVNVDASRAAGSLVSTTAGAGIAGSLARPKLESFASYNQFLQAMYVFKKAEEDAKSPKLAVKLPTNPNNLPELTASMAAGSQGTGDVIDGADSLDNTSDLIAAGLLNKSEEENLALTRSNFNNFPLKAIDSTNLGSSSIVGIFESGFYTDMNTIDDQLMLKFSIAASTPNYTSLTIDSTEKFYFRIIERLMSTEFLGNQLQVFANASDFNKAYIEVILRECE